ncbi:MAG TPA: glycerophosphodiester phosphodiesterase family protein [Solirubrobacteraceae bacterium]|nr:glycerophosphodiester phosphodiesterase family protein [Solirubrobacteraceae bacterium]
MIRALVLGAAAALGAAAPAAALPTVHAHRGGPFVDGSATYAENTLPAFQAAHARGFVVELDVRAVRDGAIALHDETLDRTTACAGNAIDMTLADVASCPSDTVGTPGGSLGSEPRPAGPAPPDLAAVLAWARDRGARLNLELNDDEDDRVARVLDVIAASGYPVRRLIVQSFYAGDLGTARDRLPGVGLSVLSLRLFNVGALNGARSLGAKWVSPEWPIARGYVRAAHRQRRRVVPYTLNSRAAIRRANRIGVDAVITDDPVMARRELRRRSRR